MTGQQSPSVVNVYPNCDFYDLSQAEARASILRPGKVVVASSGKRLWRTPYGSQLNAPKN
jgi:hypothetical protein